MLLTELEICFLVQDIRLNLEYCFDPIAPLSEEIEEQQRRLFKGMPGLRGSDRSEANIRSGPNISIALGERELDKQRMK